MLKVHYNMLKNLDMANIKPILDTENSLILNWMDGITNFDFQAYEMRSEKIHRYHHRHRHYRRQCYPRFQWRY